MLQYNDYKVFYNAYDNDIYYMIKAIVSDLDGTLVNTAEVLAKSWEAAFMKAGIKQTSDELLKNTKGLSPKDIIKRYKEGPDKELLRKLKQTRREEVLKYIKNADQLLYPDTIKFLESVKRMGLKIAVATGMSRDLLKDVLDMSGISGFLDAVVSSDDVERGKPFPDVFVEAFNMIKIDPKEGIVIGDSINDVEPGHEIGALTVFISRSGEKVDKADWNVSNLMKIVSLIKGTK